MCGGQRLEEYERLGWCVVDKRSHSVWCKKKSHDLSGICGCLVASPLGLGRFAAGEHNGGAHVVG